MTVNRAMIAEKVAGLRADQEKLLPPLARAAEQARQRAETARKALESAEADYWEAELKRLDVDNRLKGQIAAGERELKESADRGIAAFITEMLQAHNDYRRHGDAAQLGRSWRPSARPGELQLEALSPPAVQERIDALRRSIPARESESEGAAEADG